MHGKKPEDGDYIYRFVTMADATGLKEQIFGPLSHDYDMRFVLPEGNQFDLGANIRRAAELGADRSPLSTIEFASLLAPGAEWDYKTRVGPKFENFGNFHFGIVVSAFLEARTPVPSPRRPNTPALVPQEKRGEFALGVAGLVHIGTTRGGEGVPFFKAPYGDDPMDQAWIKLGMHFYHSMSISVVRAAAKL